jgi:hypothetical protein
MPLGSVALESLLATDSVMRARGAVSGAAGCSAPFSCGCECRPLSAESGEFPTRLRLREGVAIESGVSASDCCCGSGSRRERRPTLLLDEGGILHGRVQRLGQKNEVRERPLCMYVAAEREASKGRLKEGGGVFFHGRTPRGLDDGFALTTAARGKYSSQTRAGGGDGGEAGEAASAARRGGRRTAGGKW